MASVGKPAAQRDVDQRGLGGQKPLRPVDPRRPDPALQRHTARDVRHPVQVAFGKPGEIGQSAKPDRAVQMRGDPAAPRLSAAVARALAEVSSLSRMVRPMRHPPVRPRTDPAQETARTQAKCALYCSHPRDRGGKDELEPDAGA